MKYSEILPAVLDGKWVRVSENGRWLQMDQAGEWSIEEGQEVQVSRDLYSLDTWEVKPEDTYVWGTSGSINNNTIHTLQFRHGGKSFNLNVNAGKDSPMVFPKRYQKYKLVPVEDGE